MPVTRKFQWWLLIGFAGMLVLAWPARSSAQRPGPPPTSRTAPRPVPSPSATLPTLTPGSQPFLGDDSGGDFGSSTLLQISPDTGDGTVVGDTGFTVTDIAVTPDGRLFGVTFGGLLSIDPCSGAATPVGPGWVYATNALVSDAAGQLYSATFDTGLFVTINPNTGVARPIGSYGGGLVSSGDLAFAPDGTLYGTAVGDPTDVLITVNVATGRATVVGDIGFPEVWGLAFDDQGTLFGAAYGSQGSVPVLIVIDPQTGAGQAVGSITNADGLFGMTVPAVCGG